MTAQNLLSEAVSPYLLQHKDNPVHWRPWGPAALAEAKQTGKPILLSVGYAACHWCHVMAHESFEDGATAAVMNELFVNIKVDREERPDVDHLYMQALHALGEQGGWPLTMFLTPDGEPFWGGTYFPKQARYGRPAFTQLLRQVADVFHRDDANVRHNVGALRAALTGSDTAEPATALDPALIDAVAQRLGGAIDRTNGGLGGAPKFPNAPILMLLWRGADRLRRDDLAGLVTLTLEHIAQGGIYDHLGGGFARYSVDARWLVPHFEKMLYDNAQLLELLALAFRRSGTALFAQRARETCAWLAREMTTQAGAFAASLDADSDGVEGKFYVWSAEEIAACLGPADAALFARFYDVTAAGNWTDEHSGDSVSVLNRLRSGPGTPDEESRLAALRDKLLAHRARRIRPGLDDKILADWNGLMIAALVNAGTALGEPAWIDVAASAFRFVADQMTRGDRLGHAWRAGKLTFPGFASDYAAMIAAAVALHEAKGDGLYLDRAQAWAKALLRHHREPASGLLSLSADDASDIPLRLSPTRDDAVPNAHGVLTAALVRLAIHTGDEHWRSEADALLEAATPAIQADPLGHASLLSALDLRVRAAEIVVAGDQRAALKAAALDLPFLNRVVVEVVDAGTLPDGHPAAAQARAAGSGAAYVCVGQRCSLPIRDPGAIAARVAEMQS